MGSLQVRDFSVRHTLECGQLFRQTWRAGWYWVQTCDRVFKIRQPEPDWLEYEGNVDEAFLRHYFCLDEDLGQILGSINKDQHVRAAIEQGRGLRIVRQDSWECLVSYICAQASHIARIKRNVEELCVAFGKPFCVEGRTCFAFPAPGALDDYRRIEAARTGYRAKYLFTLNGSMDWDVLKKIGAATYPAAKRALMQLQGVGHKVADCVLLFSMGFPEAFPVDVWVKRALETCYFGGRPTRCSELRAFGQSYFGPYAGWAQQYLYYYWRGRRMSNTG